MTPALSLSLSSLSCLEWWWLSRSEITRCGLHDAAYQTGWRQDGNQCLNVSAVSFLSYCRMVVWVWFGHSMTMGIVPCDYQVITAASLCLTVYCLMCPLPHADQSIDGNIECQALVHLSPNVYSLDLRKRPSLDRQHKTPIGWRTKNTSSDSTWTKGSSKLQLSGLNYRKRNGRRQRQFYDTRACQGVDNSPTGIKCSKWTVESSSGRSAWCLQNQRSYDGGSKHLIDKPTAETDDS